MRLILNADFKDEVLADYVRADCCPGEIGAPDFCYERDCGECWTLTIQHARLNNGCNISFRTMAKPFIWEDELDAE